MARFSLRQLVLTTISAGLFLTALTLKRGFYDNRRGDKAWHRFLENGFMETNMDGRHPILDLLEIGRQRWDDMLQRQSKTLPEAVAEYRRRYHRLPPKGFDLWWKFAHDRDVKLIDEFDQINYDIEPYLALPPSVFNQRAEALVSLPFSFSIHIVGGQLKVAGTRNERVSRKTADLALLIESFAKYLPDLTVHGSDHDRGNIILGSDQREAAVSLARAGQYLTHENLTYYENVYRSNRVGLVNACAPDAPVFQPQNATQGHRFIHNHLPTMNLCDNPVLLETHGDFANDYAHDNRLEPKLVHSKWLQDSSLLVPALPGFNDAAERPIPWSERMDNRLFWRARTTGVDFLHGDWRKSQRTRLHFLGNARESEVDVLVEEGGKLKIKSYPLGVLNERYMDVGLVPPLVQCHGNETFCEQVEEEIGWRDLVPIRRSDSAKFVVDVDGNGWSMRFRRLLASASLVFKSTVYPEWNTRWLIPYYHYVPLQGDYSDIFDLLLFFNERDELAEEIGKNGHRFVREHWRWEDMEAYMFRLLLEYARLGSVDRKGMTYRI